MPRSAWEVLYFIAFEVEQHAGIEFVSGNRREGRLPTAGIVPGEGDGLAAHVDLHVDDIVRVDVVGAHLVVVLSPRVGPYSSIGTD